MVAVPRLSLGPEEKKGDRPLLERCPVVTVQRCSSFYTSYWVGLVILTIAHQFFVRSTENYHPNRASGYNTPHPIRSRDGFTYPFVRGVSNLSIIALGKESPEDGIALDSGDPRC